MELRNGAINTRRSKGLSNETLWSALAKSQGEFPKIVKDKTVSVKTRGGGGYGYSYADLATILAAVTPVLSKNGIAIVQRLSEASVETMLIHASGEKLTSSTPIPPATNNHEVAGSYTFFRRHALTAMLGIAADDDTNDALTMTDNNQKPVDDVSFNGNDPLSFLDDDVPASLDACKTMQELGRHLSAHNPKDKEAVQAAKERIKTERKAA